MIILERAYTGAIEEQYSNILWICWSHQKMDCQMAVVLRGNTLLYARRQQQTSELTIGDIRVTQLSNYSEYLEQLIASGGAVYILRGDIDRFALNVEEVLPGVQVINTSDLASLCGEYDNIWYW